MKPSDFGKPKDICPACEAGIPKVPLRMARVDLTLRPSEIQIHLRIVVRDANTADPIPSAMVYFCNVPTEECPVAHLVPWFAGLTNDEGKVVMIGRPVQRVNEDIMLQVSVAGYKAERLVLKVWNMDLFQKDIYLEPESEEVDD